VNVILLSWGLWQQVVSESVTNIPEEVTAPFLGYNSKIDNYKDARETCYQKPHINRNLVCSYTRRI
jgi:hypothetical protein